MNIVDWQLIDFQEAWNRQMEIFQHIIDRKNQQQSTDECEIIVFCEHPHVYTLGKSGKDKNLLISEQMLQKIGATFYHIDRGGDITYHGPGQLVGYPILDLERQKISLKDYIFKIEEAIIQMLATFMIEGMRLQGATGVWLEVGTPRERKICAIGVKASRFVTMHGFALNVNTDLNYFRYINPCGFVDKGVTSMQQELNEEINFLQVKERLREELLQMFKR